MGLITAGSRALLDRYVGYYEPYATSHHTLDHDTVLLEEVANVARAMAEAIGKLRQGDLA